MQVEEGRGVKVADVVLLCVWVSRGCLDGTAEWNETASRSRGGATYRACGSQPMTGRCGPCRRPSGFRGRR